MKIEDYKLGQKVSLYGRIEAIDIENMRDIENTTTLKINTLTRTISVNPKWEEVTIEPDKPKTVVPKFVGEWIEEAKAGGCSLYTAFGLVDGDNRSFDWLFDGHESNQDTFARAWLDGYEVEKEKLYTVEIPNPNEGQLSFVLMREPGGNVRIKIMHSSNLKLLETDSDFQLTEQEIRKDFDWAFRWAEEVE